MTDEKLVPIDALNLASELLAKQHQPDGAWNVLAECMESDEYNLDEKNSLLIASLAVSLRALALIHIHNATLQMKMLTGPKVIPIQGKGHIQ